MKYFKFVCVFAIAFVAGLLGSKSQRLFSLRDSNTMSKRDAVFTVVDGRELQEISLGTKMYTASDIDVIVSNIIAAFPAIESGNGIDSFVSRSVTSYIEDPRFGNLPTNNAFSQASVAFGYCTVAGQKAYRWKDFDFTNNIVILENEDVEPVGFEVGDIVSIINDAKYPNCAKITAITNNEVYVSSLPFSVKKSDEENFDRYTIYIEAKPEVGDIDIGQGSVVAGGVGNRATGFASHAEGLLNFAAGQYSHVEGRNNYGQYMSHVEGQNNVATGFWSHVEGKDNVSKATLAHVAGQNTEAVHNNSWTWNGNPSVKYTSKGQGFFAVNPNGGTDGFYIGSRNMTSLLNGSASTNDIMEAMFNAGVPKAKVVMTNDYNMAEISYRVNDGEDDMLFRVYFPTSEEVEFGYLNNVEIYKKETVDKMISNLNERVTALENRL